MLIATFGPSTGWAGKTITREGEFFILEGHGPISAADVMKYDKQGHLVWATEGTRAWVAAKTLAMSPSQASWGESAAATTTRAKTATPLFQAAVSRRLIIVAVSALVIVAAVAVIAFSGALRGNPDAIVAQKNSWPNKFEGTWVSNTDALQKEAFSQIPGRAIWTSTNSLGGGETFEETMVFEDGTLAFDSGTVYERQSGSGGDFVGTYDSTTGGETMRVVVGYDGNALTYRMWTSLDSDSSIFTYTIAGDGRTMTYYNSNTGESTTYTRQ
jgi:hypothetical protein